MEQSQKQKEAIREPIFMETDEKVIEFIVDFIFHGKNIPGSEHVMYHQFACGYCYYFAVMLQNAFPGGQICVCYPFGHIVYIYKGVAYDIDGVSGAEVDEYIPIEHFGKAVNDFKHIKSQTYGITKEEMEEKYKDWIQNHERIKAKHR